MAEPMSPDRLAEMEPLFRQGGHGICYDNIRAAGRECVREIERCWHKMKNLEQVAIGERDNAILLDKLNAELREENARLKKTLEKRGGPEAPQSGDGESTLTE